MLRALRVMLRVFYDTLNAVKTLYHNAFSHSAKGVKGFVRARVREEKLLSIYLKIKLHKSFLLPCARKQPFTLLTPLTTIENKRFFIVCTLNTTLNTLNIL